MTALCKSWEQKRHSRERIPANKWGNRPTYAFFPRRSNLPRFQHSVTKISGFGVEERTVIVGGGVIGLSTAYQLAKRDLESCSKREILVIEASDVCFKASSLHCTGCFHYAFTDQALLPMLPLGKYSFDLWESELADSGFRPTTGYRAQSSYGICRGTGEGLGVLPDWIIKDCSWNVDTSVLGNRTATVLVLSLNTLVVQTNFC